MSYLLVASLLGWNCSLAGVLSSGGGIPEGTWVEGREFLFYDVGCASLGRLPWASAGLQTSPELPLWVLFFYIIIILKVFFAALHSMRDLSSYKGSNPCPWHWKRRVSTSGWPRKSPCCGFFSLRLIGSVKGDV